MIGQISLLPTSLHRSQISHERANIATDLFTLSARLRRLLKAEKERGESSGTHTVLFMPGGWPGLIQRSAVHSVLFRSASEP